MGRFSAFAVGRLGWNYIAICMLLLLSPRPARCFHLLNRATSRHAASLVVRFADGTPTVSSNQQLVQRRISVQRAKRAIREQTLQERADRNFRLKQLLHDASAGNSTEYPLYAVKVWVAEDFREELRLSGRERRGRVFLTADGDGVKTLKGLKSELHAFFAALKKDTYLIEGSLPIVLDDGTILPPSEVDESDRPASWPIQSDEDVLKTFEEASKFFVESSTNMTRPSIVIKVLKNPDAPPPPPPPPYLDGMPDPGMSQTMTMLSFYSFPPEGIEDPEEFALRLRKLWKPFNALGRVYVAAEGVNAQMSVPTNVLSNFMACCKSLSPLAYMENGINIDPKPLTMEEFAVAGVPNQGKPCPPFRNLHVRVRTQIVADGLTAPLDWQSAGYDMPPMEWHEKLREASDSEDNGAPILLDCRNSYESSVGTFQGAEPLDTENFRESWNVLRDRLQDTPKDAPIMTFCTGGIRCVKVGAYLTQELGFTNVSRLAGGIIAYDRTLSETSPDEESLFKGTNFVFDGRLGRQITEDAMSECLTCGSKTSCVSNCRNDNCHKRMVQCENCRTDYLGTCSDACHRRLVNGSMMPRRLDRVPKVNTNELQTVEAYSAAYSSPAPSFFKEMELNTRALLPSGSHMVSGEAQGRLLTQLASMTRGGRILELGTFTGYSAACFLEGARQAGDAIGVKQAGHISNGPCVVTMERDVKAFNLAAAHLGIMTKYGIGERAAEAAASIRNAVAEIPSDRVSLVHGDVAGCELLRVNDALATVEDIAAGEGDLEVAPFDLVFVDADKTRLLEYVESCLRSDRILKRGGLIVVDNVLWKGLVIEAATGEFKSISDSDDAEKEELRKNRRARKLATTMHLFNAAIVQDDRVEVQLLPVRDGLSIIRKK